MTKNELLKIIKEAEEKQLTYLDLSGKRITELPPEIGNLKHLKRLELGDWRYNKDNKLTSLPKEIEKLTNLKYLDLSRNLIQNLPEMIGQLTNLKELYLSHNKLSTLPEVIGQLTNLTRRYLSNNQINTLPEGIEQLTNLTSLYLNNNQLSTLPKGIGELTKLWKLDLRDNQLSILPEGIGQLTNLKYLYLSNNQLNTLPEEIGQLTNLKYLYLKNNQLSTLPKGIKQLTNLRELNLSNNQLSTLPEVIGQLTNLKELDLSNNQLSTLPEVIGQLTNLWRLGLSNNPLPPLPPEIRGISKIINYYLALQNKEKKKLNEAKMLLVGRAEVGKSSLLNRLLHNEFNEKQNTTDGIIIEEWQVKLENDRDIRLNIWDFGGQEIMHATHQFFLTKRSLYILVWDARQDEKDGEVDYWLKLIKSFGGDSPVIIVLNKIDQGNLELDRRGLMAKYENIKDFVRTSCRDNIGIDELKEVIKREVNKLEHLDTIFPSSWFEIKEELEDMDKDYIEYEKYEIMCNKKEINEESQLTLIKFLHDLGIVLNYQDDARLSITNILNPEWVTTGVYKIINSKEISKGILEVEKLKDILDKKEYPKNKWFFIIDMMKKFELCFELDSDKKYLIPELLPKETPEFKEDYKLNSLAFQYHYDFLPSSVISRFIVRMNLFIFENVYWRSGVILADEKNKALVRSDTADGKIFINIIGEKDTRRDFLAKIRSNFEHIHKTISEIKPKEIIPLPDNPQVTIPYEYLLKLEKKGIMKYYYPPIDSEIDIKGLLDGVENEIMRSPEKRLKHLEKQFDSLMDKIALEEEELIITTDVDEKFKLEQRIKKNKDKSREIKKEIKELEEELRRMDK